MCTHNQCFRAKKKNTCNYNFSFKKLHFYRRERLLYIPIFHGRVCVMCVQERERERGEREREIQSNV